MAAAVLACENLAIDSGGIYGPVYVGALAAMGNLSRFTRVLGVSVGAFVALLVVLGYSIHEIGVAGRKLNPRKIISGTIIDSLRVLKTGGRSDNSKIYKIVGKYVAKSFNGNPDATFGDLYKLTGRQLIVVGTNIRTGQPRYFNTWSDTTMPIRVALKITGAIPIVCQYVTYENEEYYDGAYAEHNLLEYFDARGWANAIGLSISRPRDKIIAGGITLVIHAILMYAWRKHNDARVIQLYTSGIGNMEAEWPEAITGTMYNLLFSDGYASVKKYMEDIQTDVCTDSSHI